MAFITPASAADKYDVIVVGSGAAGGQAAYTLAMDGARVLMIEAGRNYDPRSETPMFQTNDAAPLRAVGTPDKAFGFYDATVDGGWSVPGEPYTNASMEHGREFKWWRARMLGGRTNHWGRIALRNGPYDFKPRSRDGLGFDWPISYEDVAPYYDKVEMLIGVYRLQRGLENTPNSPDGVPAAPPKARIGELLRQRGRGWGSRHPGAPGRPLAAARPPAIPAKLHPGNAKAQRVLAEDMQNRAACFWATACGGCSIRANYQSTTVHIPPAMATGNLDIVTSAMAREVTLDPDGKATGVAYIDKTTGKEHHASARAVVLAASACETVRLLLNSKSTCSRTAWPTRAGSSASTSWTRSAQTGGARSRCSRTSLRTTRTARGAATSTRPGGSTRSRSPASSASRAGTTSSSGRGAGCPGLRALRRGQLRGTHNLRRKAEGGGPPLLRLLRGFTGGAR
jgi:choline dehydrogenase-like flavoprotein